MAPPSPSSIESPPQPGKKPIPPKKVPWWLFAAFGLAAAAIIALSVGYFRLAKRVDQQLTGGAFQNSLNYFSASEVLTVGDAMPMAQVTAALKQTGGVFSSNQNTLLIQSPAPFEIQFANGAISSMVDLTTHRRAVQYELPPRLITNMPEEGRVKRTLIKYSELPPVLIQAIVAAEDKRFFQHSGFDGLRIAKAFYIDLKEHRKEQGASTISMQLARNLWLGRDKSWKRKIAEALITVHLEGKLSKEQILEDYANMVYLGGRSTFGINGFGEAARAYFNKDVHDLNLTEAAMLAGLIQRPSYFNPFRYPERALDRRNVVLSLMRDQKFISPAQYEQSVAAPLGLHPGGNLLAQAQYFLDMASDEAWRNLEDDSRFGEANVYTTIDLRLQDAAERAIADGMQLVDKELASRRKRGQAAGQRPQVALIALDPHTGEVKALSGGRDYAASQLNRILAKRPPGSVFKPFVYTAALSNALGGGDQVLTQASTVDDSPSTFVFDNQTYSPGNFKKQFMGRVTLRQALAHSLNVATVKVGQMAGFNNVVALARQAGMNDGIQPTPAVALGAYRVTPFEIARAYTIFANQGTRVQPVFVSDVRDGKGAVLYRQNLKTRSVLDPRVAFLMVDMLQEVIRSGTAAGVRARGFTLPAAGKTGTSHDGWFAGFTSQLLCVVWVGFDDYTELGLEGARSALPIWTEFMMQAAHYKQYADAKPFQPPAGVLQVSIDPSSGQLAGPNCPGGIAAYFINGTQPTSECAPQDIEVIPTADGGVIERANPSPAAHASGSAPPIPPERSISVEVPVATPPEPRLVSPPVAGAPPE